MAGVSKLSKSQLLEERAKQLGERFGLELSAAEWQATSPDDTVLRMDKSIRMRVRRTCHKCEATFTQAKECPNCQHVRCTKCVRHPPKRTEAELQASRERRAAIIKANKANAPIIPDWDTDKKDKHIVLTRPRKTGGQDLVHKKPRQRVRRTCHECQTLFTTGTKTCKDCGHVRCTDCPRDPYVYARFILNMKKRQLTPYLGRRRTSIPSDILETSLDRPVFRTTSALNVELCTQPGQPTEPNAQSAVLSKPTTRLVRNPGRWNQSRTQRYSSRYTRNSLPSRYLDEIFTTSAFFPVAYRGYIERGLEEAFVDESGWRVIAEANDDFSYEIYFFPRCICTCRLRSLSFVCSRMLASLLKKAGTKSDI